MRRTNRVPQSVLWSFLLSVALGHTALAQQPPPQPVPPPAAAKEGPPAARGHVLYLPVNGTLRVQMASKQPIEKVFNEKEAILLVQPVVGDPTAVLITGREPGVTHLHLVGQGGGEENFEVIVQGDVEFLRRLLRQVVPTAAVEPVPGANGTVVLTGTVGHAEDVDIIMRTAVSVMGAPERVINAMTVGGVMQVQLDTVVATVDRTAMRAMGFNLLQSGPSAIFGSTIGNIAPVQTAGTVPPSAFNNNSTAAGGASTSGGGNQTGIITGGLINAAPGAANLFLGVVTRSGSFFGFLQALRDENLAKLLTEPRLVTLSGKPANLHSGGEQAIPQPQGLGTVGVTFQPFGTDVVFLPIVLGNGKINLDIQASVSALNQAFGTTILGTSVPGRTDQNVHAVVELEDGQTLAIGGLIQHTSNAFTNKVPILGDLPWVGAAFSVKSFTDDEQELVILVTPHLVDPMACNQVPKLLPGQETRTPDDYELFLEGILEAPRGPRVPFPDRHFVPAYKNGPTAALYPCAGDGRCAQPGPNVVPPPAGDSPAHPNPLPLGNLQAKPLPPVAATPPAGSGQTSVTSPATSTPADTAAPAVPSKPAEEAHSTAAVSGSANQDDKVTK
jgi:pilus assembly protein CpaC